MAAVTPATIALIVSSLAEAMGFAMQLAELIRRVNAGEITEDQALADLADAQAEYSAARRGWDDAGAP